MKMKNELNKNLNLVEKNDENIKKDDALRKRRSNKEHLGGIKGG